MFVDQVRRNVGEWSAQDLGLAPSKHLLTGRIPTHEIAFAIEDHDADRSGADECLELFVRCLQRMLGKFAGSDVLGCALKVRNGSITVPDDSGVLRYPDA